MFNRELANRTLAYIREHLDEWDQSRWDKCFAGAVLKVSGYKLEGMKVYSDGRWVGRIPSMARDLLGVSVYGNDHLFADYNNLEDLERIVVELSEADNA